MSRRDSQSTRAAEGSAQPGPPPIVTDAQSAPWLEDIEAVNQLIAGSETVRIGILTPLTPPGDPVAGALIIRGARLGVEYVHERGGVCNGKQIELVVENDQAAAATEHMARSAVGGFAKLAIMDEVMAVLGQWHLRTAGAVAEAAAALGVPTFIENGHEDVTRRQHAAVFRTYMSIPDRIPTMMTFMNHHGFARIGLLAANTAFGKMIADGLEAACDAEGVELMRIDFDQESTFDLLEPLRRIQAFEPDIVINGGVVRTNYIIINQAHQLGLFPATPMMACFPFPMRSDDLWRLSEGNGTYLMWPCTQYRPSMPGLTEMGAWFTERYHARYGSFPPDNALNAFTDIAIIAQALGQARAETRAALLEVLETGTFDTWRGPVQFRREHEHWHHSPPPIVIMQYNERGQQLDDAAVIWPPEVQTGDFVRA